MKFSIIVPVYNVEKFLTKCLESIVNQTYKNFEAIIVNDGSPDNSQKIIDEFEKKYPDYIKGYKKENGGLSDARNFGIEKATGDYLVLVDSDDFINLDLLEKLNDEINKNGIVDVIGFQTDVINSDYSKRDSLYRPIFTKIDGKDAIELLISKSNVFETAWSYCYNLKFWRDNKFEYAKGLNHEDLGLTPYVIAKASKVTELDYSGYNYYQSDTSIMRSTKIDWDKKERNALDVIKHYCKMKELLEKDNFDKKTQKIILEYFESAVWWKLYTFPKEYAERYAKEIKKYNIKRNNKTLRELKDYIILKIKYKI